MKYITIDDYYPITFYNECKEALKNNGIKFNEFISIKPPYNWYFQLENAPIMINYEELPSKDTRWLVNIVNPLTPNEDYLFLRRENDNGPKALSKFVQNKYMSAVQDYGIFFTIRNREQGEKLSKEFPGKIIYFGKYYNNKFRVCLSDNKMIKNYISPDQILLENNGEFKEPGRFEAELNFKIFRGNDMLIKFTDMPYFKNGKYKQVKIKSEISSRFNI